MPNNQLMQCVKPTNQCAIQPSNIFNPSGAVQPHNLSNFEMKMALFLQEIVKEAYSVVVAGGTMKPIEEFKVAFQFFAAL